MKAWARGFIILITNFHRYAYTTLAMTTAYGGLKYTILSSNFTTEMQGQKGGIERTRLNQMFEVITDEITIYHFYNSRNPLHDEYNK